MAQGYCEVKDRVVSNWMRHRNGERPKDPVKVKGEAGIQRSGMEWGPRVGSSGLLDTALC